MGITECHGPQPAAFTRFSDAELKAELARRDAERKRIEEEKRKARMVEVVCPACDGNGTVEVRDIGSGYPCSHACELCCTSGSDRYTGRPGVIMALRAK